jgi:hypothetical protein
LRKGDNSKKRKTINEDNGRVVGRCRRRMANAAVRVGRVVLMMVEEA